MRRGIFAAAGAGGEFTPADLPNLLGWWDAGVDNMGIFVGGKVFAWREAQWPEGGSSNHFNQPGGAALCPTLVPAHLNGRDTLHFNGTGQFVALTTPRADVRTAAILCKWEDKNGDFRHIFAADGVYDYHGAQASLDELFQYASPSVTGGEKWINGVDTPTPKRYTDWTRHIFVPTANTTIGNFSHQPGIPGREFKGHVAEIVLMSSAITTADRLALDSYWAAKYNL